MTTYNISAVTDPANPTLIEAQLTPILLQAESPYDGNSYFIQFTNGTTVGQELVVTFISEASEVGQPEFFIQGMPGVGLANRGASVGELSTNFNGGSHGFGLAKGTTFFKWTGDCWCVLGGTGIDH